jgi:hypothetical protein
MDAIFFTGFARFRFRCWSESPGTGQFCGGIVYGMVADTSAGKPIRSMRLVDITVRDPALIFVLVLITGA